MENNKQNIIDEDTDDKLIKEQDIFVEESRAKELANYIMLHNKYNLIDDNSYQDIYSAFFNEEFPLYEERKNRIVNRSKEILLEDYSINIINDNHIK